MKFNIFTFIQNLFHKSTPSNPNPEQGVINQTGAVLDTIESGITQLQTFAPALPEPYKTYLGGLAVSFHQLDSWVDNLETQTTPATATTSVGSPTGPKPISS
jgi:hypothetical protein